MNEYFPENVFATFEVKAFITKISIYLSYLRGDTVGR